LTAVTVAAHSKRGKKPKWKPYPRPEAPKKKAPKRPFRDSPIMRQFRRTL